MILGAVLLEPDCIFELILESYHFSQKKNQLIFQVMTELREESQGIDVVTVVNKLGGQIESIGGVSYLTSLAVSCPTTVHLEDYQEIVLEHYKFRELKRAAARFLNDGRLIEAEQFYQTFIRLQEIGMAEEETKQDLIMDIFNEMYEDQGELNGIDTGFDSLNRMTSGWSKGDLIVLAARPSMGKTAFALSLAMNCCKNGGVVDVFSLEMPKKQLAKRILSNLSKIDGAKWKNPYRLFTEEDQAKANTALGVFHQWHLQIHDPSQKTVSGLRAQIQKTRREFPDEDYLVVIDYLQLIAVSRKYDRHDLAIASITKELKQLARQYEVPIILLSQLSRGVEQRMDKRPKMSDLVTPEALNKMLTSSCFSTGTNTTTKTTLKTNLLKSILQNTGMGQLEWLSCCLRRNMGGLCKENGRFSCFLEAAEPSLSVNLPSFVLTFYVYLTNHFYLAMSVNMYR